MKNFNVALILRRFIKFIVDISLYILSSFLGIFNKFKGQCAAPLRSLGGKPSLGLVYKGNLLNKLLGFFKSNSTACAARSVGFMSRDLSKWFFFIPLFLLGLKVFVTPSVKEYFPLTYAYLVNMISMLSLSVLVYCLFLWYLMLCVFYVIEFYIFLIYSIRSEDIHKPKYLPKFTRNWLTRLEQEGKSELKEYYIHVYSRNILVNLFLIFLVFLFTLFLK